jgi:hypothetical protein
MTALDYKLTIDTLLEPMMLLLGAGLAFFLGMLVAILTQEYDRRSERAKVEAEI